MRSVDQYPMFSSFFGFSEQHTSPKPSGKRNILASELALFENIRDRVNVPETFRDQGEMTISEVEEAAVSLWDSPVFSFFRESNTRGPEKKVGVLAFLLDRFIKKSKNYYDSKQIFFPHLSAAVRKISKEIFTKKTEFNGESVYKILGMFDIYGLFHMFCTQMVPVGLNFDFAQVDEQKTRPVSNVYVNLVKTLSPESISATLTDVDTEYFGKEQKWISNDKETRNKIANEMFTFVKEHLTQHPEETITIIEPGAGNGEFTSILAELVFKDPQTRGKVNLVLKEYSEKMISEGRHKFERLEKKLSETHDEPIDLKIHYICGSADIPLQTQLEGIRKLVETREEAQLQKTYQLTFEQAEKLLNEVNGTKVVGAVSTYTFGAMGEYASGVAKQTMSDVSREGKIVFVDFAERPPNEYIEKEPITTEKKERIKKLRRIFDIYGAFGFAQGLAINLGFWEHDVLQIWRVYHDIISSKNKPEDTSSEIDLKPFAFLPISTNGRSVTAVALPGYFEMFIRTQGLADPNAVLSC